MPTLNLNQSHWKSKAVRSNVQNNQNLKTSMKINKAKQSCIIGVVVVSSYHKFFVNC